MVISNHSYAGLQQKESKQEKNWKMYSFGRKRTPGNLMLKPWFVLEEIRKNGIKGAVSSGQDPTQLIWGGGGTGLQNYLFLESNNKSKLMQI